MTVQCLKKKLENNTDKIFGIEKFNQEQNITIGKEYLVVALSFYQNNKIYGTGLFVQILDDRNLWSELPIELFKICNNRISKYWELRKYNESEYTLWPSDFHQDYYFDDLIEMMPDIVNNFRENYKKIEKEFDESAEQKS